MAKTASAGPLPGAPVEWTEEETYFFRLSKYEATLLKHYEENPDLTAEVVSFVKGGLQDLSVSRTTIDGVLGRRAT